MKLYTFGISSTRTCCNFLFMGSHILWSSHNVCGYDGNCITQVTVRRSQWLRASLSNPTTRVRPWTVMVFVYENPSIEFFVHITTRSRKNSLETFVSSSLHFVCVSKLLAGFQGLGDFFCVVNKQKEMAQRKVLLFFSHLRMNAFKLVKHFDLKLLPVQLAFQFIVS